MEFFVLVVVAVLLHMVCIGILALVLSWAWAMLAPTFSLPVLSYLQVVAVAAVLVCLKVLFFSSSKGQS